MTKARAKRNPPATILCRGRVSKFTLEEIGNIYVLHLLPCITAPHFASDGYRTVSKKGIRTRMQSGFTSAIWSGLMV